MTLTVITPKKKRQDKIDEAVDVVNRTLKDEHKGKFRAERVGQKMFVVRIESE